MESDGAHLPRNVTAWEHQDRCLECDWKNDKILNFCQYCEISFQMQRDTLIVAKIKASKEWAKAHEVNNTHDCEIAMERIKHLAKQLDDMNDIFAE